MPPPQNATLPGIPSEQEFAVNIERFVGLTPWVLASEQMPPCDGWWKTRLKSSPDLRQPQRRYWTTMSENVPGMKWGFFSAPVHPDESDEEAEHSRTTSSNFRPAEIEWCGLMSRHPNSPKE